MSEQDPDDPSWTLPRGVSQCQAARMALWPRGIVRTCGYPKCDRPATKDGHCSDGHPGVRYDR